MKLDINRLTNNLKQMAGITLKAELNHRPFYQGIPFIAKLSMEYGAVGSCVSNVEQVKELMQCGIFDYMITTPLEDFEEAIQLSLTARIVLTITLDSDIEKLRKTCQKYQQCIEVIVDYDFSKEHQKYVDFIEKIYQYEELDFAGIQAVSKELMHMPDYFDRYEASYSIEEDLEKLINLIKEKDIPVDVVTGLSSATTKFREDKYFNTVFTESQAGNYAIGTKYQDFNDLEFEQALLIDDDPVIYLTDGDEIIDKL